MLLSAHYDSRGSFGSTRAPGANDDGSGVTHLLAIARAIKANGIKFKSHVELVAFAGEEQGLYGSNAYASQSSRFLSCLVGHRTDIDFDRGVERAAGQHHSDDSGRYASIPFALGAHAAWFARIVSLPLVFC